MESNPTSNVSNSVSHHSSSSNSSSSSSSSSLSSVSSSSSSSTSSSLFRLPESLSDLQPTFQARDVRDDYTIGSVVGKGSFSTVNECFHKETGNSFAVKSISKATFRECSQIENELRILKMTRHENVIQLIDVYETDDYLYLVMELIKGGDLFTEISSIGPFNEMKAHSFFCHLFEAIKYLHSINIVHRDLKLENILINDKRQLKISDFGLSKILRPSDEEFMKTRCGTPSYVAPEILLGELYTASVDIWSLGVVLYLMVFSQYPFLSDSIYGMYEQILRGDLEFPSCVSNDLQDLIRGLLTVDTKERLSLQGIANHPWVTKYGKQDDLIENTISLLCRSVEQIIINDSNTSLTVSNIS